ncbi:MAG: HAMP domain-containing histidine kinase [Ignavibacteriae bacterium]|nr:HAMP domain-containing histidine kinase [Ignavibacteriota bacterium]
MRGRILGSLYWKLSAAFLVPLLLVGAGYTYLTLFSSEMYFAETSQRLNVGLAQRIVEDIKPFINGKPNLEGMNQLFHDVMVVNPSVEVYLLDSEGKILTFDAPKEKVKARSVSLQPIAEFLQSDGKKLVLGDNPRDLRTPKVFSVAPVTLDDKVVGYVYVILSGEEFDSTADRIRQSHFLTLGLQGLLVSLAAAGCIGLAALALVTRKLRRLTAAALAFTEGDYSRRVSITSNDELDELGRAFNTMADTLSQHVSDLERTDALRRELIANVSHDLRTPLASAQGYLETVLMKESDLSAPERQSYLEIIFSNMERLSRLIEELFELSKLEAKQTQLHVEPFSIADLANDLAQKFAPIAEKKEVRIVPEFSQNLPSVVADIGLIDRVLHNLLDNAISYTNSGGEAKIVLREYGSKLRVSIEDTGVGISAQDLPYVFNRFYQSRTHGKTGGAGLGLAIAKKILEAHGEVISVESRAGEGTKFSFELPLAKSRKRTRAYSEAAYESLESQ